MQHNTRAIAIMVGGMACFAVTDLCVKLVSQQISSAMILILIGTLGAAFFAVLTRISGYAMFSMDFFRRPVMLRNLGEILAQTTKMGALALAPLSMVSAVIQATPIAVTLGAALFLGERVGPRRWAAVIVGMVGVLLILQPWTEAFSLGAMLALGAVLGQAMRDVTTKLVPKSIPTLQLTTWAFLVLIPAGAALLGAGHSAALPDAAGALLVLLATAGAAGAYYAVTAAMRLGEASVVTPFRYTRIVFAIALAVMLLGERPDGLMLAGIALIIASGLYVLLRERQEKRRQQRRG
jgi:drug/metabolite transporter (DMT)-like permease